VFSTESIGPATAAAEVKRATSANEKKNSDRMLKKMYKKNQRNVDIKSRKGLKRTHSHAESDGDEGNLICRATAAKRMKEVSSSEFKLESRLRGSLAGEVEGDPQRPDAISGFWKIETGTLTAFSNVCG